MRRSIALFAFCTFVITAWSQRSEGLVSADIQRLRSQGIAFPRRDLFQPVQRSSTTDLRWNQACSQAEVMMLDHNAIGDLLSSRPAFMSMELPTPEGSLVVDLEYVEITTPDFSVVQASTESATPYVAGAHYRGMVRGSVGSLAAISVFQDEVMGLISDQEGDLVLGRLTDGDDGMHIVYREADLLLQRNSTCGTVDDGEGYAPSDLEMGSDRTAKCVRFYWEVNYDIFQGKGGVVNATNYVTGLFNQSAILYANDGISVVLSQVYVWDVPSPYVQTATGDLLDQFGVTRTSFNGDLAHLVGYAGGGGVAWLNTLCNSQTRLRMAYSDINSSFSNVPTYSWSVEVVTHEQGHNMGSRHTHACAWNGNNTAIDGCGPAAGYTEGTCAQGPLPTSTVGGTIMSYCHLTSSTIKFANGFGPQPTAVIVNAINNASCLVACATSCSAPAGLTASSITTTGATLSWTAVSGAVSYNLQWRPNGGTWTTVTGITGTSHPLSGLATGTLHNFQVMTVCSGGSSSYAAPVNFTTTAPPCNVPTALSAGSLTTTSALLSWGAVSGAISYNLQWKPASSGIWTTVPGLTATSYPLTGLAASTAYNFQVMTVCSGGSSVYSTVTNFTTNAASCSDPYESNGTQATATVIAPNVTLTALIGSGTDLDWFRFSNSAATPNIRIRLTNLPANYNIRLYKGNTQRGSSSNTGTTTEQIILNTTGVSSNWYVRVIGASSTTFSTTQCYTLSVDLSATPFALPEGSMEFADVAEEDPVMTLFPNPANDLVTLMLPAHEGVATVELMDALGRVVQTETHGGNDAPAPIGISVAGRNEGLYLVRATLDGRTTVLRLVVTR